MSKSYFKKVDLDFKISKISLSEEEESELKCGCVLNLGKKKKTIVLTDLLNSGGEGNIFMCKDFPKIVVKIYKPETRTNFYKSKVEHIVSKRFDNDGFCWPLDSVYYKGKFVGFVMERVNNKNLTSLVSNKTRILKRYPDYDRLTQVNMIIQILNRFKYMHDKGVIFGDIKLENIAFDKDDGYNIKFLDLDGIQIGKFPCRVSTIGFDAPEAILCLGKENYLSKNENGNYKFYQFYNDYYRTKEIEQHSLAVLLYSFLMNGMFPYSYEDHGFINVDENCPNNLTYCINGDFAYGLTNEETNRNPVKEKEIWSYLPSFLKKAFRDSFTYQKSYNDDEWIEMFENYKKILVDQDIDDEEAYKAFPSKECDYKVMEFSNVRSSEAKGLTMEHAVLKAIYNIKDKKLRKYYKDVSDSLKLQPEVNLYNFKFKLIYNIGILKKVKIQKLS